MDSLLEASVFGTIQGNVAVRDLLKFLRTIAHEEDERNGEPSLFEHVLVMRPPAPQNQSSSPPRSLLLVRRDLRKQTDEQGIKQSVVGGGDDPLWPLSAMDPEDKKKLYNLSSLDKRMVESSVKDEFAYITYLAYPLFDNKTPATLRSIITTPVAGDAAQMLLRIGYSLQNEQVLCGWMFTRAPSRICIRVFSLIRIMRDNAGEFVSEEVVGGDETYIVEVNCVGEDDRKQKSVEQVMSLASLLSPFVEMSKVNQMELDEIGRKLADGNRA